MTMGNLTILYITCRDAEEAKDISKKLLDKKLVACGNMLPMNSMYEWEGKLNEDSEVILLLKTTKEKAEEAEAEIKGMHSYNIPCILKLDTDANPEYLDWVKEQTK
ncbi:divalent-cation tolerance protein CutA [Nanoarchaeota archaeon]